jgi:hypothetical protein
MGRTLFIGDSHTMGYIGRSADADGFDIWQDNNYAEIYSQLNNKPVVIMASSGCGNREYVNFLAYALKTYDDIDEVFIQATHWGRFPLAINPNLDEQDIFPLDFFIEKNHTSENIDRFSIGLVQQGKYLQAYTKPDFKIPYDLSTRPNNQPIITRMTYMYVHTYHYVQTHLAQQDYFKDILVCDVLCHKYNVKLKLWNMTKDCFIPKKTANFYTELTATTITNIDAERYIGNTTNINFENNKIDSVHYNKFAHEQIARHYIPYLRSL